MCNKRKDDFVMKFVVRKAEEKDLDAIVKLYEEKGSIPYSPFGKEKREIFRQMLNDKSRHLLVGEKDCRISAFVSLKTENSFENFLKPSAFILDIKAENSDGEILTAVLSRAKAVAMENGCVEISLKDKNINAKSNAVYCLNSFKNSNMFFVKEF